MKFALIKFVFLLCLSISFAEAQDPCPQKFWGPQISDLDQIQKTPIDSIDLKAASNLLLDQSFRTELNYKNNDCGDIAWNETRKLEGLLDMYEATSDQVYLDKFVIRADAIYKLNDIFTGKVDELRHQVVFGWSSLKYTAKGQRHVHGVQSGIIAELYARFSRIVLETQLSKYSAKADSYYSIATQAVAAVMDDWDPSVGYFRFQPNASPRLSIYPYNQGLTIGSAYLELYRISLFKGEKEKAEKFKPIILEIGEYFKNFIDYDKVNDRYLWRYAPGFYYEDMSHASLDMTFVLKAYENGLVFKREDMRRFGNTMAKSYIPDKGQFARYLDGYQLKGYTNWYSLTCLMVTDFAQFLDDDKLVQNCQNAVQIIIGNKNVLLNLDNQFLGLLYNGIPKIYKIKKEMKIIPL